MTREGARDIGWSLLWAAVLAAGPHTGRARPLVSLAGGALAGGAVLALRRWRRRNRPVDARPRPLFDRASLTPSVWALLGGFLALFAPTFVWLYGEYGAGIWRNAHGFFVPVCMALLAAERLRNDPRPAEAGSAWGIPWILAGAGLALLDAGMRTGLLASAGLVIALPGLSLLLLGARRTRALAGPLALGVFLIPLPERVPDPLALPTATALLAEPILKALGYAVERQSTVFVMREAVFKVSTNCSGVATLYGATFFAALLAMWVRGTPRRLAVLASIWPATVAVNALRVTFLFALTADYGERVIHSPIHGLSGIATFWLVMLALYAVAGFPSPWRGPR